MRLPLAQRELARLGRSRRLYAWRTLLAGSFMFIVLLEWLNHTWIEGRRFEVRPEVIASELTYWCMICELVLVSVIMPLLTAPLISAERRDQTLSLLLLADFRGWDIFAAKFLSAFLEAGMLLISLLPIQLITTFLGGVSPDIILAQMVVLVALITLTCCMGLFCSAIVQNTITAALLTACALLTAGAAAASYDWFMISRGRANYTGFLEVLRLFGTDSPPLLVPYRRLVIIALATAMVFAIVTARILPHMATARPRRYFTGAPTPYGHTFRRLLRWGSVQPILSVHATGLTSTLRTPAVRVAILALLTAIAAAPLVGAMVIVALLVQEITVSLVNTRRSGALDDLRLTVVDSTRLAPDIFLFYWRRGLLYVPALAICALQVGLYLGALIGGDLSDVADLIMRRFGLGSLYAVGLTVCLLLFGLAQLFAIVAVGCLMGILSGSPRRQTVLALLVVTFAYALSTAFAPGIALYVDLYGDFEPVPWLSVLVFAGVCTVIFYLFGTAARTAFQRVMERGTYDENGLLAVWRGLNPVRGHAVLLVAALAGMLSMTEIGVFIAIDIIVAMAAIWLLRQIARSIRRAGWLRSSL